MPKKVKTAEVKPNITLTDIGKFYTTDGKGVWQLTDFKPEPQVKMIQVSGDEKTKEGGLSEFKDFIRLLPEQELKKPRKTRSDKGMKKNKVENLTVIDYANVKNAGVDISKQNELKIVTPHGKVKDYTVSIGVLSCGGKTLREAVNLLLFNYDNKIPDFLSDEYKKTLEGIISEG